MSDEKNPLSILSTDELDKQLKSKPIAEKRATEPYEGPDRRTDEERRSGPRDRREMLRFEPEKERADRRAGRDRRSENNMAEDMWKQRDL